MKKISEYRQHAAECRSLAQTLWQGEQRNQLLDMARAWDGLADERAILIVRRPELASDAQELAQAFAGCAPDRADHGGAAAGKA